MEVTRTRSQTAFKKPYRFFKCSRLGRSLRIMNYEILNQSEAGSVEKILEVERIFDCLLPAELKEILLKSDGATYWKEPKEIQFLGTKDMVGYYESYEFSKYFPESIPFAMDGNGNFIHFIQNYGETIFISSAGNLSKEASRSIAKSFQKFMDDPQIPEEYLFDKN